MKCKVFVATGSDELAHTKIFRNLHRKASGTAGRAIDEYRLARPQACAFDPCGPGQHARIGHGSRRRIVQVVWNMHKMACVDEVLLRKEELIDEMATMVLAQGARQLVPAKESTDWTVWAAAFGGGLRKTLLAYCDGARMVAGSRLTNTEYIKTVERIGTRLIGEGLTVRQAVVLLSTIYNYTLSFVMEEQAVFPRSNERSPQYDIAARNAKLDPKEVPVLRQSGAILVR